MTALIRVTLNAGLMKPRRGFTPVPGKQKLGERKGKASSGGPDQLCFFLNLKKIIDKSAKILKDRTISRNNLPTLNTGGSDVQRGRLSGGLTWGNDRNGRLNDGAARKGNVCLKRFQRTKNFSI